MRIRNSKFNVCAGFTLLEVVVAMAIVGLGVVTLLEIFSLVLRLSARSSVRTEAVAYSQQVMDEVLTRREVREGGEEGSMGGKYRWSLQVKALREETQLRSSSSLELKEITLEMRYREGEGDKEIELKTLRLMKKKGP